MFASSSVAFELKHPSAITINTKDAFIHKPETHSHDLLISLPNHDTAPSHVALDIGGSLSKVVYYTKNKKKRGGTLCFANFATDALLECLDFLSTLIKNDPNLKIIATGGGAFKYHDLIKQHLGLDVDCADEMQCLIAGASFLVERIPNEIFIYNEDNPLEFVNSPKEFPWLVVNIGSGVSMLKVTGPSSFERIGGSTLGGGTLWGLLSLLTGAQSYDDMLKLAESGDNRNVDMLVGDIYGTSYSRLGLSSTTIASSFGKVFRTTPHIGPESEPASPRFEKGDIALSLLYAISNNIGQLAYLHARYHKINHVFFGGSYIRGHPQTIRTLAYAIRFWSKGEMEAYFFRHEGYLGAVGAFLQQQEPMDTGSEASSGVSSGSDSS